MNTFKILRKMMLLRLIVVFLCFMALGCQSKTKLYVNYADRVKIHHPLDWTVQEEAMGTSVTFLAPLDGEGDTFQENLNIIAQDIGDEKVTLEQYSEAISQQLQQMIPGIAMSELMKIKLSGSPAMKMVSSAQVQGMKLLMLQAWTIKNNKSYMLTFTSMQDAFPHYEKTVEKMLSSFKIIE